MGLRRCVAYTLFEILIAIVIVGFAVSGGMRLFLTMQQGYAKQTVQTEMHQNAQFAVRKLSESFEEAGADLPLALNCLGIDNSGANSVCTLHVNPFAGTFSELDSGSVVGDTVWVGDAGPYWGMTSLAYKDPSPDTTTYQTATVAQIDTVNDFLRLSGGAAGLGEGTMIFATEKRRYFLDGTNLCQDTTANILAENIVSFSAQMYDTGVSNDPTDNWYERLYFTVEVKASTGRAGRFADTVTLSKTLAFKNL